MPVRIEASDQANIARSLGKSGKPAPDWVTSDPALDAAYREAAGLPPQTPAPKPKPTNNGTKRPSASGAGGRAAAPSKSPGGAVSRPKSSAGKPGWSNKRPAQLVQQARSSAGTTGGILIAIWVYPILLAMLEHGPAGATMWLKAKFLNDTGSGAPGSQQPASSNTPPPVVPPTRPPWWKGQWPPPGTTTGQPPPVQKTNA